MWYIFGLLVLVNLVDRNPEPGGFPLVDPDRSGKKTQYDLVELASQIQTVRSTFGFAVVIHY